jgi:RNA polymerase sigma-70 factor (ECF subfamily)
VPLYIARIDASKTIADEVQQRVRERLLAGAPPRIAEYAARGSLGAWVRVAAVRIAIDLKRSPELAGTDALDRLLAANDDPELALVKARYRPELDRAVRETSAELSQREATLLRLHFADGVAVERLARSYQVHRATVTRWIADARQRFVDGVYRRLAERLGLSRREFESLMPAVVSQLHLSLRLAGA